MDTRFIRVLQKDIVTKPEEWKNGNPGKFIKLPDRAKNVYCVLSVIAYSSAGNAKGTRLNNGHRLGKDWFWTSHRLLQQLTGSSQKTVQRGIKELKEGGFVDYHASKAQGQKCFFKIKRVKYNTSPGAFKSSKSSSKKNEDGLIWLAFKSYRTDLLTPAQEKRVNEIRARNPMPKEPPKADDDIPF